MSRYRTTTGSRSSPSHAGTGALDWQEDVPIAGGPAPLALSPDKQVLYVGRRGRQEISSYRVDQDTGGLSLLGTTPLQGEPVYVSTDRTGRFVLSAYYYQSTAAVHAVDATGVATFPPVEWRLYGGWRARHPDGPVEPVRVPFLTLRTADRTRSFSSDSMPRPVV